MRKKIMGHRAALRALAAAWLAGSALGVRCATSSLKVAPDGLEADDRFGAAVAAVGDIDGDGVEDLAVGAPGDNHGSFSLTNNAGAVYFVLRDADGGAKRVVKAVVEDGQRNDWFGSAVARLGDLDGDGRDEIAVGAPYWDEKGRVDSGAMFVYSLNADASVRSSALFSAKAHGSTRLGANDNFGVSLAPVGDVDGAFAGVLKNPPGTDARRLQATASPTSPSARTSTTTRPAATRTWAASTCAT